MICGSVAVDSPPRRCSECGQPGEFYESNQATCKGCVRERSAARRMSAPTVHRNYQRRYRDRQRLRAELKDALLFRLATSDLDRFGESVRTIEDSLSMEPGTLESSLRQNFVSSEKGVKSPDLAVVAEAVADLLMSLSPVEGGVVFRSLLGDRPARSGGSE